MDFPVNTAENRGGNVIVGFLFEWRQGDDLSDIPAEYNVISLVFSPANDGSPNLRPLYLPESDIAPAVSQLKETGRTVLLTLGGADTYIALYDEDKEYLISELLNAVERYGADGVVIDLEGSSISAADNASVIPAALREVKDYYRAAGRNFIIALTPEFPNMRGEDASYGPYLRGLEGYYDIVFPQYYNQGEDGVWYGGEYLAQDDEANKAMFLYALTDAIIHGEQGYIPVPADRLAIGLPTTPDAAFNGYVQNPGDVEWALERLAFEGNPIRGLMGWSVNHDAGNQYFFARDYAPMVFG